MTRRSKRQPDAIMNNVIPTGSITGAGVSSRRLVISIYALLLPLTGCPYYAAPPGTVVMTPASFDRSFAAASGAMSDEGVAIITHDPARGALVGEANGSTVTASVRQQTDGSVIVQFSSPNAGDPSLLNRISRSYDRRMGR